MNNDNPKQAAEKLAEIVAAFDVAMLVSVDGAGSLRARPMSIANDDEATRPPHRFTFVASRHASLVSSMRAQADICVTMQDANRYVCLGGRATTQDNHARAERLWSKPMERWFPNGPSDPDIVLIDCDMDFAEYWDVTGTAGLRFMLEAGKALVQGRAVNDVKAGAHGELTGSRMHVNA
jgi:general stress protein 26